MNIVQYLLGELLHLANSSPPFPQKRAFYSMKNSILERHGKVVDVDLQHIVKLCYYCDGRGRRTMRDNVGNGTTRIRLVDCHCCGRTGKYQEFWVYLFRYQLGRREFHSPFGKTHSPVESVEFGAKIEGYIDHSPPPYYLSAEAFYWLALIFDFNLFRFRFGRTGYPARKFTPMVILSDVIFRSRFVFQDLFYRDEIPF